MGEEMQVNQYDRMAQAYDTDNENNAWNAGYERPALLALAGDVCGRRVLDAGCGAGAHALALQDKGADVIGCDISAAMLALAKARLAPDTTLIQTDLNQPLPWANAQFDLIVSSLVMHYLPDWCTPLSEFWRVLRPGGRLVFSTHHPFLARDPQSMARYFETHTFDEEWLRGGKPMCMRFWHRPLSAMVAAVREADFIIDALEEPMPQPEVEAAFPKAWQALTTAPRFLFFVLRKPR